LKPSVNTQAGRFKFPPNAGTEQIRVILHAKGLGLRR
jgi:hypothetical protein